jgi:hypothetical protein
MNMTPNKRLIKMPSLPEIKNNIKKIIDNSNLLRAILILVGKDKNIWDYEKHIFIREGMALGYDKEYCENTIHTILQNPYINLEPPVFIYKETALKFLQLGTSIIQQDVRPHPKKIQFLEIVAYLNDLKSYWETVGYKNIVQIKLIGAAII